MTNELPNQMTSEDLQKRFNVTRNVIRGAINRGHLKAVKINNLLYFDTTLKHNQKYLRVLEERFLNGSNGHVKPLPAPIVALTPDVALQAMRSASDRIDKSTTPDDYHTGLVAMALAAREYLRRLS